MHLTCSCPLHQLQGRAHVGWVGVQEAGSRVWLQPPPYFRAARFIQLTFSISLWFKLENSRGEVFQYLLSQQGTPNGHVWGPSQVRAALLGSALKLVVDMQAACWLDTRLHKNGQPGCLVKCDCGFLAVPYMQCPSVDSHHPKPPPLPLGVTRVGQALYAVWLTLA